MDVKSPVEIFQHGDKCYVWKAEDVLRLRRDFHVYGSLVGGVSQFKNQNNVHGLPLQLSSEETSLLLLKGWGEFKSSPFLGTNKQHARLPSAQSQPVSKIFKTLGKRTYQKLYHDQSMQEYYAYYDAIGAYSLVSADQTAERMSSVAAAPMLHFIQEGLKAIHKGSAGGSLHVDSNRSNAGIPAHHAGADQNLGAKQPSPPASADRLGQLTTTPSLEGSSNAEPWVQALAQGSHFSLPITADETSSAGTFQADPSSSCWSFPSNQDELIRLLVFCDLHEKGYTLSGGAKFGADLLAYPGHPSDYHAQFTVRPMCPETSINPMLLKSASRGSHAARKHLLMATVPNLSHSVAAEMLSSILLEDDQFLSAHSNSKSVTIHIKSSFGSRLQSLMTKLRSCAMLNVSYLSIGPETGFGGTKK
ncbi:hypothetical protein CEUSTIGMA_g10254.t1 [Chlamydomonas eustigma]|uniref:tRNA-intron lyase n=1 Tax=Chlamydomonas eustigma TaxID=1157962 RepID=A0A250XIC3_9CHLO|nr:hypothetical protein CEUSTIGMA_g10254.t1 [Chlamydomonas eustigma]|eukprot:GAX82828.1 hypothetical protein CEUSTIGMA_g10254.t1 [Chlamydomonas eustigma]